MQAVSGIKPEEDFYSWLEKNGKLSPFNTRENTNLETFRSMYGKEFENTSIEDKVNKRYDDITNMDSPYYQKYREYLQKMLPNVTPDSLLAPLAGSGFNHGTSQKIATERAQSINAKRNEAVSQGVKEFALSSQSQGGGLLGMLMNNSQFMTELAEKRRQFDESQPSFGDSLLNLGSGILGWGFGGGFGGSNTASGFGDTGGGTANSRRATPGI